MSAAAFAKGLLDLEGQLTPILVCHFGSQRIYFIKLGYINLMHIMSSPNFLFSGFTG